MRQTQNCYNQQRHSQNHHEFLVCTHNNHHLPQDSERVRTRPPAARVSILYCHGAISAELSRFKLGRSGLSLPGPTLAWKGARLSSPIFLSPGLPVRQWSYPSLRYSGILASSSTCSMALSWPVSLSCL